MTSGFGSRREKRSSSFYDTVASSVRPGQEPLSTRTVVLAATVTLLISVVAVLITSLHVTFLAALVVTLAAVSLASFSSAALARLHQGQRPTPAEEQSAVSRIQAIVSSLLDRYGMEEPEIDPPVKLVDTAGASNKDDLERRLAAAESTSSEFFLAQLVDNPRLTVILGEQGAGKTSLLLRLSQRMLDPTSGGGRDFIPLFIKCRDWPDEVVTFHKWVTGAARASYDIPKHVSDYWIRSGKLFVALDGLHELPPERFIAFSGAINSWIQAAEGTRIAISSTMQPRIIELVHSLGAGQICVIQPLPDSEIQSLLRQTLRQLSVQAGESKTRQMDIWMQSLISQYSNLRGPALVGLLAEAIDESRQIPDDTELNLPNKDPADLTFRVANSFFSRGDYEAARDSYRMITRLSSSRWHVPAYTLLATCEYLLGNTDMASDTMREAVALRLKESIRASPDAMELSDNEERCLGAVPLDVGFDIAQISSAANLPLSQARQALQALREHGLVETVASSNNRARFRRSNAAANIK